MNISSYGYAKPCNRCHGAAMTMQPCGNCGGDGNAECRECYGAGYSKCRSCTGRGTEMKEVPCYNCIESGKVKCNVCNGEGEVVS